MKNIFIRSLTRDPIQCGQSNSCEFILQKNHLSHGMNILQIRSTLNFNGSPFIFYSTHNGKRQPPSRFSPKLSSSTGPKLGSHPEFQVKSVINHSADTRVTQSQNNLQDKIENRANRAPTDEAQLMQHVKDYTRLQNEQMQEAQKEMMEGIESYDRNEKEFSKWMHGLSRKMWGYAIMIGVVGTLYMLYTFENRKRNRAHTSSFYDPEGILNSSNIDDVRIGRTTFLIEGRLGLSSNSYIAKIDPFTLFVYNNFTFNEDMKHWIGQDVKCIYLLVPNKYHNYLLKSMVGSLAKLYPHADFHIFVREGVSAEEAFKSWKEAAVDLPAINCEHCIGIEERNESNSIGQDDSDGMKEKQHCEDIPKFFHIFKDENDFPEIIRNRFKIIPTQGLPDLDETVLLDKKHRLLVLCDLMSNIRKYTFPRNCLHFSTLQLYYKLKGLTDRFTPLPPKSYRILSSTMDGDQFIKSLNDLTFLPNIKGLIVAHGEPILPSADSATEASHAILQWRAAWQEYSPKFKID